MSRTVLPYCLAVSRRIGATPPSGVLQLPVLLEEPKPAEPAEAPEPPAPGPTPGAAPDPFPPPGSTSWPTQAEKPASATIPAPSNDSLCPWITIEPFVL